METFKDFLEISTAIGSMAMAGFALWLSFKDEWAKAAFFMAFAAWLLV